MEKVEMLAIALGAWTVLGLFARFCPKDKLWKWAQPSAKMAGTVADALLVKWLPKKLAQKIEESIIVTVCYVVEQWLNLFQKTLLENNEKGDKT